MRQQLIQYVQLLFAGAHNAEEMKQEILQNTLDRYDDLISQGKSPEAAYRLAISGIGDIDELLNGEHTHSTTATQNYVQEDPEETQRKVNYRGIAIAMYILCPVPLFILSELGLATMGLCLTLALVATATYVIIISRKTYAPDTPVADFRQDPEVTSAILKRKAIQRVLWSVCTVIYLLVSFLTGAWYITWILFPIFGCIQGLIHAILDLREVVQSEN